MILMKNFQRYDTAKATHTHIHTHGERMNKTLSKEYLAKCMVFRRSYVWPFSKTIRK